MSDNTFFTVEERQELPVLYGRLLAMSSHDMVSCDYRQLKQHLKRWLSERHPSRNVFGIHSIIHNLRTAIIVAEEIGLTHSTTLAILLHDLVRQNICSLKTVEDTYGKDVIKIVDGLLKIDELYAKNPIVESENFRNLLLSFSQDVRVVFIMIADRVNLMRQIRDTENQEARAQVANEAAYLYAPLAHKLGLYKLKSELEDLSLKYTQHNVYYDIKEKLNATKAARDSYIANFIKPIEEKLNENHLRFHIKGRTKSIHSIWQKMQKQKCPFSGVYDLFAIRIILDTPLEREKQECWQVYSLVTDMYKPNPKRLRDWLSMPKSNGYESLHITVMGPEGKWVEIQIRTQRMDEIAERGVAAHWRYKGVKAEQNSDELLANIRQQLETAASDSMEVMDQFKLELYEDDLFVFSPKGDLYKLPKGSTVLDFAFSVHSKLGCRCVGGKVNGKNVTIRQQLQSGDQVEILTSTSQTPKRDWLKIVATSKARTKIRQSLKELEARQTQFAKETIERKFKNRKMEFDEATMMRLIKKMGYKVVTDFYQDIADEHLDVNDVLDSYLELQKKETEQTECARSAENYNIRPSDGQTARDDVVVIDTNLKGVDFTLAKCCSPIYGDDVFGFVTVSGGIKIHRNDCPNAATMKSRFGYRIVKARWAGKSLGKQYPIQIRVVGHDDIGIITNITSVINKETSAVLRNINISSNDGLFSGILTVMIDDTTRLEILLKKIQSVKGVKQVNRN
ncbi:MAG: RelA/SpoT family protein [Bacteroidales bacterium]|nr:RelA/SpoT family protein [Bacteroidales bacterium]